MLHLAPHGLEGLVLQLGLFRIEALLRVRLDGLELLLHGVHGVQDRAPEA
jgi:hypothetical protein